MVARLTGVVLLLILSSPLTAPPLQLVHVAFKDSHLRRLAILPLLLNETSQDQYQRCR